MIGKESLNSLHHVSLLAVRQQEVCARAETAMEFVPEYPEQLAGLAYMYDAMNFYLWAKTVTDQGETVLVLLKSDGGVITDEILPISIPEGCEVRLRAQVSENGEEVCFSYQIGEMEWESAKGQYTTEIVTDEHCRGFTGAHFGLYIHDMTGLCGYADFRYFKVCYGEYTERDEA
jgi:xylan 1,4-beta-xylosidase